MECLLKVVISLLALADPRVETTPRPSEQLKSLQRELDSALKDYTTARNGAGAEEDRRKAGALYRERANAIAGRAVELARSAPGDRAAFDAFLWVIDDVRHGAGKAFDTIARDAIESERVAEVCRATAT